jgi:NADH-quinone oxidoreductase subunit L
LTSGFLSKDGILAGTLAFANLTGHWLFPVVGFLVAMLTAFYMFRLVILTFHGKPADQHKYDHAHESPFVMVMPLVILAGLSVFFWYTPNPINAGSGWFISEWVKAPEISVPETARFNFMMADHTAPAHGEVVYSTMYTEAVHHSHIPAMLLSLVVAGLGILTAFLFYQWKKINADTVASKAKSLYNLSLNKWYFDEIYDATFVAGTLGLSRFLAWFDLKVIDGIVDGSASLTKWISSFSGRFDNVVVDGLVNFMAYLSGFIGLIFRRFQTGRVQTYVVLVIFSLVILLFLFKSL